MTIRVKKLEKKKKDLDEGGGNGVIVRFEAGHDGFEGVFDHSHLQERNAPLIARRVFGHGRHRPSHHGGQRRDGNRARRRVASAAVNPKRCG
jgi:hypothetical protein